jgi:hypothetical protein
MSLATEGFRAGSNSASRTAMQRWQPLSWPSLSRREGRPGASALAYMNHKTVRVNRLGFGGCGWGMRTSLLGRLMLRSGKRVVKVALGPRLAYSQTGPSTPGRQGSRAAAPGSRIAGCAYQWTSGHMVHGHLAAGCHARPSRLQRKAFRPGSSGHIMPRSGTARDLETPVGIRAGGSGSFGLGLPRPRLADFAGVEQSLSMIDGEHGVER